MKIETFSSPFSCDLISVQELNIADGRLREELRDTGVDKIAHVIYLGYLITPFISSETGDHIETKRLIPLSHCLLAMCCSSFEPCQSQVDCLSSEICNSQGICVTSDQSPDDASTSTGLIIDGEYLIDSHEAQPIAGESYGQETNIYFTISDRADLGQVINLMITITDDFQYVYRLEYPLEVQ